MKTTTFKSLRKATLAADAAIAQAEKRLAEIAASISELSGKAVRS